MPGLPGEEAAWQIIHSPLRSSDEKARARVKLAEIEAIRRRNEQGDREYRERVHRQRHGTCPHCGAPLTS